MKEKAVSSYLDDFLRQLGSRQTLPPTVRDKIKSEKGS